MRVPFAASVACALALFISPAGAIVGPASNGAQWQKNVVMVLSRSGAQAGFCTGVVLSRTILLTAAHCVSTVGETRAYLPGQPLLPVRRMVKHPGFHADAPRTRTRSIDLALIALAEPLPSDFAAPALAAVTRYLVGTRFQIAGYGVSREGDGKTSGVLRTAGLRLREPLSSVLLWLEGPEGGAGACTGDSGGPVFTTAGELAAIIAFAEGVKSRQCGALTQAVQIAPQRAWIESTIQSWR